MRLIQQSDFDLLSEWVEHDPAHKGILSPSFWFDPRWISFVVEDIDSQPVMFVKFVAEQGAIRLYIQFCPEPKRVAKAMCRSFPAVKTMIEQTGARAIVFDTLNPNLAQFCHRHFGFERVGETNDYKVRL